eukprot:m.66766 g.66766  ORF g.66766 m.66766 type:complete len:367 (-) comp12663_c0_seq3:36-1136(-)
MAQQDADSHGEEENADVCMYCGEEGELICCDSCPQAFHFVCCEPPLGEVSAHSSWYCSKCHPRTYTWKGHTGGDFQAAMDHLLSDNARKFTLPPGYVEPYSIHARLGKKRRPPLAEDQSCICFLCKRVASGPHRVACSECGLAYHFDCLDPPLTHHPRKALWICPVHPSSTNMSSCPARLTQRLPAPPSALSDEMQVRIEFTRFVRRTRARAASPTVRPSLKSLLVPVLGLYHSHAYTFTHVLPLTCCTARTLERRSARLPRQYSLVTRQLANESPRSRPTHHTHLSRRATLSLTPFICCTHGRSCRSTPPFYSTSSSTCLSRCPRRLLCPCTTQRPSHCSGCRICFHTPQGQRHPHNQWRSQTQS